VTFGGGAGTQYNQGVNQANAVLSDLYLSRGFAYAASTLRHTHIWLSFGPVLDRVLVSPALHQVHRSRAGSERVQKADARWPVDGKFVVPETRDGGQTFVSPRRGLPVGPSYDLVYRHALVVDPSGDLADRYTPASTQSAFDGRHDALRFGRCPVLKAANLGPAGPHAQFVPEFEGPPGCARRWGGERPAASKTS